MTCPSKKFLKPHWIQKQPSYYGADKYFTKGQLMAFIHRAAVEMRRILMDDGCLWFKWGERLAKVDAVLPLFDGFQEMMRIPIKRHGQYSHGAFWVMLMKKEAAHD
jgi:hypothetical protein